MAGAFTLWSGLLFFSIRREYLLYFFLGAGLSRGWRDCSFLWLYFSDSLFRWTLHLYLQSGAEWLLLLSTDCKKKLFPSQVLCTKSDSFCSCDLIAYLSFNVLLSTRARRLINVVWVIREDRHCIVQ